MPSGVSPGLQYVTVNQWTDYLWKLQLEMGIFKYFPKNFNELCTCVHKR